MTLTTLIRTLVTSFTKDAKDVWGAIVEEWNKRPDPKRHARTPPKNWNGTQAVEVPDKHDWIQAKDTGGFPNTFDEKGLRHVPSESVTVAEQRMDKQAKANEIITAQEYGEMKVYRISDTQIGLHNLTLAAAIKRQWKQGKKPREIGLLVGCSESTARHYCICFERAQKASNATPLF